MTGKLAGTTERVTGFLREFFVAEQTARGEGFLQSRDPRLKLLSIVGLLVGAMLTRTAAVLVGVLALTALLARLSAVPLRRLLARSAPIPLASMLVVSPQAVLMPGEPLVGAFGLAVTDAGVAYVGLFTLRVAAGVSLLSVLVLTTPFATIVGAMRRLYVPVALVWVIAVTYRYLFLFFDELRRLVLARNSRTAGEDSLRGEWRDARRLSGTFLLRALDRGERVGRGMRARGGGREPTPYDRGSSLDVGDCALAATAVVVVAVAVVVRWGLLPWVI